MLLYTKVEFLGHVTAAADEVAWSVCVSVCLFVGHLQCNDVQSVYDLFLLDVFMLMLCNIPTVYVTVSPRDPSYVTPLVKSLLNKRRRLHKWGRLDEANIVAGKINLLF